MGHSLLPLFPGIPPHQPCPAAPGAHTIPKEPHPAASLPSLHPGVSRGVPRGLPTLRGGGGGRGGFLQALIRQREGMGKSCWITRAVSRRTAALCCLPGWPLVSSGRHGIPTRFPDGSSSSSRAGHSRMLCRSIGKRQEGMGCRGSPPCWEGKQAEMGYRGSPAPFRSFRAAFLKLCPGCILLSPRMSLGCSLHPCGSAAPRVPLGGHPVTVQRRGDAGGALGSGNTAIGCSHPFTGAQKAGTGKSQGCVHQGLACTNPCLCFPGAVSASSAPQH